MALSIKTEEADRLARRLSKLTGESLPEAVTKALRERLERERLGRRGAEDLPGRLADLLTHVRAAYDTRPVSQAEWDSASGDEE